MNPLRLFADLLHRANQRRIAREKRRRQDAAIALYEKRHARCITVHGDCCPQLRCDGDPHG